MEIYLATTNAKKLRGLQRDLRNYGHSISQREVDLIEPRSEDVREIAEAKIKQAYPLIQEPTVVIDGGFYIDSLGGFPGAFCNYALKTIKLEGIIRLVEGKDRVCEFRDCLAYQDGSMSGPKYFLTASKGSVAESIRGDVNERVAWSKLWQIFVPQGSTKTWAEMSEEEISESKKLCRKTDSLGNQLGKWLTNR